MPERRSDVRRLIPVLSALLLLVTLAPSAGAQRQAPEKDPVAVGTGGAVATVDPEATGAGLAMLRRGGNAIDAAVAAAATLGVTEPYSSGIGGGGFMLVHLADEGEVVTIDGREDAPDDPAFDEDVFVERTDDFQDAVNSGLSVGTPGTFATWVEAIERYGSVSLARALQPAVTVAQRGFVVDQTYADQTAANLDRFRQVEPTAELFLDDGEVPEVGSVVRNQDLARTYRLLQREGLDGFYQGELAQDVVATVQDPPTTEDASIDWQPGLLTSGDLAGYEVLRPDPTRVTHVGLDVYGMGPPSSGGTTVGETLNVLAADDLAGLSEVDFWHRNLEASALAFADRNAYLGDDRYVDVPVTGLLSEGFAAERRSRLDEAEAAEKPVPPGDPCPYEPGPCTPADDAVSGDGSSSTTHLVTADRWGNVVSYTLTIEQIAGSALTVPGRGFLLNNELTDFNREGDSPNLAEPGKRPRSSMSPTIVLEDDEPRLAVGSPGGATIIGTAANVLMQRFDRGLSLPDAIAAPRANQLNIPTVLAEPAFLEALGDDLEGYGHAFTELEEIGAATGLELLDDGRLQAVAEPERRGGGDAAVVRPEG